ncbi:DUF397 domain-containing protein [Streptomyces brevispora]|uniref:DUF397 domain-containing protein n=1 Tax=Streptomyces brevispora TaxID=887462 RepID=A0A561V5R9_9ACTN|nr:DUF397 domain-containing protein [Streptomyces brevispora]TWG06946.1 uncharacterized protein DUF397 [Streptomyces brevispora]WSC12197.1 DUF397 domain-containing protein [Streptomyces brevispora]
MISRVDLPTAVPESAWFKSSYSSGEGGECVEVAWRKSSYSGAEGGQCLEFAAAATRVHVRDSKQTSGPVLTVGPGAWMGFVGLVTS